MSGKMLPDNKVKDKKHAPDAGKVQDPCSHGCLHKGNRGNKKYPFLLKTFLTIFPQRLEKFLPKNSRC
jgi:hypothetical protein